MSLSQAAENAVFSYPKDTNNRPDTQAVADLFRNVRHWRASFADLAANPFSYIAGAFNYIAEGDALLVGVHLYTVAASAEASPDVDLTASGGVKLFVQESTAGMVSVLAFGVVGDKSTDDATAMQLAFDWWDAVAGRKLMIPAGLSGVRLAATCTANFEGRHGNILVMESPITPDAGIGNAIELLDGQECEFKLWVSGGGQTADYTQADPVGADQAFLIRGIRSADLHVRAYDYAGRVVRATTELAGEAKTSRLHFISFSTGEYGAPACGQAIYADASSAFGHFSHANWFWDDYGPVFEDVADLSFGSLDSGWDTNSGMVLKGVLSFWANSLSIGDESNTIDLLTIQASATRSSANINIGALLLNKGNRGLVVDGIDIDGPSGSNKWTGVRIGYISSLENGNRGAYINDSRWVTIDLFESHGDEVGAEVTGASRDIEIGCNIVSSAKQSIIVGGTTFQANFKGSAVGANASSTAATSAIDVTSTGRDIEFDSMSVEAANVDYLYDLVAGNFVVLTGGNLIATGSAAVMGANAPRVARNVRGYRTENGGIAQMLNTTSNIVITHGLVAAPQIIQLTGRESELLNLTVDSIGATTFNVVNRDDAAATHAVTSDQDIYWEAKLLQSQA